MHILLHCVGRSLAQQGAGDIAVAVSDPTGLRVASLLNKVATAAWEEYRAGRSRNQLQADILEAAKLSFADARAAAAQVAVAVAAGHSELAGQVERFVTLVPASIRASLRRADDPTGTTLPADYAAEDADDIVRLLPPRLPRFKPGDAPDWLGGWELVEYVGAGGFGEVWKVRHPKAQDVVRVVKFGHALTDAEQSLLNEGGMLIRLWAAGGHPGVVSPHDGCTHSGAVPWLRYEYMPGGDLSGLILQWQGLPPAERLPVALAAFRDLCRTVGHFHRLAGGPVVHLDLKPSNVLLNRATDRLLVADFGIGAVSARRALEAERAGSVRHTARLQSYLRGSHTPLYASPQQRAGGHNADPRDDVYALGVIAYQMLTGLLDQGVGPDFADDLRECGVGDDITTLLGRCVSVIAERRPADAEELADELPLRQSPNTSATVPVGSHIGDVDVSAGGESGADVYKRLIGLATSTPPPADVSHAVEDLRRRHRGRYIGYRPDGVGGVELLCTAGSIGEALRAVDRMSEDVRQVATVTYCPPDDAPRALSPSRLRSPAPK